MWPGRRKAPLPKGRRLAGHWPGSNTCSPAPRTKHGMISSSVKGALPPPHNEGLRCTPPPVPPEEVVTGAAGFEEEGEEYPILKIPPSFSHPKNTSATNFPRRVKFYLSHLSLCMLACCKRPGEAVIRLCLLPASVY